MTNEFALDLKVARRKSGLTQQDCAHLLAVDPSRVSHIESGKKLPTIHEICTLSMIYGRSFERLFAGIVTDAKEVLNVRLATIPECPEKWMGRFNRLKTLNALGRRLEALSDPEYGSSA